MSKLEIDIFGGVEREKSIQSKRKGSDNERAVAKFFSEWVGEKFVRVPSSGGLSASWQGNRFLTGDVVPVSETSTFVFSIEAKFYKELKFGVLGKRNKIYGFWQQAVRDAELAKKIPLLIVRHNGMPKGEFVIFIDREIDFLPCVGSGFDTGTNKYVWGYNSTTLAEKMSYREFLVFYLKEEYKVWQS